MKNLFALLFGAFIIFSVTSCSDDECDLICPQGTVLSLECECVTTDPCAGVTCPAGQVLTVDCNCVDDNSGTVKIITVSGSITSDETWTNENVYELANKVVVDNGATLTIEPGTIIKGREGTGSLATALIIARGSRIEACGTASQPIIFTSTLDNIRPGEITGTNLSETNNELWGGVIILGNAPISAKDGDTETQIEGIPADDTFGLYGGSDVNDDSGSICYVSIRHGGALIGSDNEINGLTLGGVGNGTIIHHVEVVANLDDGVECFGGTVNLSDVLVTYQGDDAIDLDMNYSGTIDNFMIIHGGDDTDEALEIDGPEGSTYTDGLFTLRNGTCIAMDQQKTSAADLKSKAQGYLQNITWRGYDALVKVRTSFSTDAGCTEKSDAYTNVVSDMLVISDSEIVGAFTIGEFAFPYIDSKANNADQQLECLDNVSAEYQTVINSMINDNNNTISSSISGGANTIEFESWTWTDNKGLLNI
ncbi:MAG: hypothetical protein HKN09_01320 [Saprospiraceae bacterium]|nr:hypothetical protein [Saprospiraceae bacterium]